MFPLECAIIKVASKLLDLKLNMHWYALVLYGRVLSKVMRLVMKITVMMVIITMATIMVMKR